MPKKKGSHRPPFSSSLVFLSNSATMCLRKIFLVTPKNSFFSILKHVIVECLCHMISELLFGASLNLPKLSLRFIAIITQEPSCLNFALPNLLASHLKSLVLKVFLMKPSTTTKLVLSDNS